MHRGGSGSLRDFDWGERRWDSSQASMARRERRSRGNGQPPILASPLTAVTGQEVEDRGDILETGLRVLHDRLWHLKGHSVKKATMKLDLEEKTMLESLDRGDWKSAGGKRERARYSRYVKARSGTIAD
jgi:hypothetical protein